MIYDLRAASRKTWLNMKKFTMAGRRAGLSSLYSWFEQRARRKGCQYHMKTIRCVPLCNKGRWRGPAMVVWRLVAEDRWGVVLPK